MEKNRLYVIIFVLSIVVVILFGIVNMLTSSLTQPAQEETVTNRTVTPTSIIPAIKTGSVPFTAPTPTPTIPPERRTGVLQLEFPVKFETIAVDYIPKKNQMIVFYPQTRTEAEATFQRFLTAYQSTGSAQLEAKVEFIGLNKGPGELIPGQLQQ